MFQIFPTFFDLQLSAKALYNLLMTFRLYLFSFFVSLCSMITSLFFVIPAFKRMNFPVGTFARQLSFDGEKLRAWLNIMQEAGRLPLIAIQHKLDDWFALSFGLVFLTLGFFLATKLKISKFKIIGALGFLGGILDLVENRMFLEMVSHIQEIDSTSAIIFSIVNLCKWSLYAIGIIGFFYIWLSEKKK